MPACSILFVDALNEPAVLPNILHQGQPTGWNDMFITKLNLKMCRIHITAILRYTVTGFILNKDSTIFRGTLLYPVHLTGGEISGGKSFVNAD